MNVFRMFAAVLVSSFAVVLYGCAANIPEEPDQSAPGAAVRIEYAGGSECSGSAASCAQLHADEATDQNLTWEDSLDQPAYSTLGGMVTIFCCGATCYGAPADCSEFCRYYCAP